MVARFVQEKRRFFRRSAVSCANSSDDVYLTPTYDTSCNFASSGASCGVSCGIWVADTGFGSHSDQKRCRPPSSTVLNVHSTVSAVALIISVPLGMMQGFSRLTSALSSGERRYKTQSLSRCLALERTTTQMHDSGQIGGATIAHHKEHENTRNLQEAHVSQRRTISYNVG